jgi:hypothetical protein
VNVDNRARRVAARLTFESLYFLSRFIALNPGEPHRRAAARARRVNNFVGIRRGVGVVHDNPPRESRRELDPVNAHASKGTTGKEK